MNEMTERGDVTGGSSPRPLRIRVWDLPTRLFHWSLVLLLALSVYTGNVGGLREMDLHKLSGFAILALILFRIVWGVVGSPRSRFTDFVRGPRAVVTYAKSLIGKAHVASLGHNPMGGWSVLAMLASLLLQAATGLFAHDEIFTKGPLAKYVSSQTSNTMTAIHEINATVLYVLIGFHLAAVFGYLILYRENLIWPMLQGSKVGTASYADGDARYASVWAALAILAASAGLVWVIVTW